MESSRFGLVAESIDGAGVRIRRYRDEDVPAVQAACDDPLTQRFLPLLPSPYTREDAVWWVREGSQVAFDRGGGNFAIADPRTDQLVGGIGVSHEQNGNGEIGYWMAPWGRRRGTATAATRALTDYAFAVGYGRMQLRTEAENTASQRVALAAGFTREGVQRGAALTRGGGRHDLIVWSRLPGDPPGPAARILPDLPGGTLTDGTVALRPIGPADGDALLALYSDVEPTRADPVRVARICAHAGANWLSGTRAHLAVVTGDTGRFAGEIALFNLTGTGEAMAGYAIVAALRGRGLATAAVRLLTGWALTPSAGAGDGVGEGVGLARVLAGARPDNLASQRVLTKAGFTREGYQRGHLPAPDGGRADVVSYAILATDLTSSR